MAKEAKKPGAASYDKFKEFQGKRYTGMAVGRRHKWRYDPGEWTEKKVTPDKWEFQYAVKKHRAGKAPEGSGAPVGTAYHWYILAHQTVTKLDANSYTTEMVGVKHKLAHRRADKSSWSAGDTAQRRQLIKILQGMIAELEKPPEEAPAEAQATTEAAAKKTRAKKPEKAARPSSPVPGVRKAPRGRGQRRLAA
jgi:hypothetical protein